MFTFTPGSYAVANSLRGFSRDWLRVKVIETLRDGATVLVTTADLADAGTMLALDAGQLTAEVPEQVTYHRDGLVVFA